MGSVQKKPIQKKLDEIRNISDEIKQNLDILKEKLFNSYDVKEIERKFRAMYFFIREINNKIDSIYEVDISEKKNTSSRETFYEILSPLRDIQEILSEIKHSDDIIEGPIEYTESTEPFNNILDKVEKAISIHLEIRKIIE